MSCSFKLLDEKENEEGLLLMLLLRNRRRRKERQPDKTWRSFWVRAIFTKRKQQEDYHNLVLEMRLADREFYFR